MRPSCRLRCAVSLRSSLLLSHLLLQQAQAAAQGYTVGHGTHRRELAEPVFCRAHPLPTTLLDSSLHLCCLWLRRGGLVTRCSILSTGHATLCAPDRDSGTVRGFFHAFSIPCVCQGGVAVFWSPRGRCDGVRHRYRVRWQVGSERMLELHAQPLRPSPRVDIA